MLFYAYCAPATHSPLQHSAQTKMVAVDSHSHEHGDHSHDDLDFLGNTSTAPDHHHADHTHEKTELVAAGAFATPLPVDPKFPPATARLVPVHKRLFFRVLEVFCSLKRSLFARRDGTGL
ncbi:hypothetical protein, partial [Sinorhizobium meliloti]